MVGSSITDGLLGYISKDFPEWLRRLAYPSAAVGVSSSKTVKITSPNYNGDYKGNSIEDKTEEEL